MVDWTAKPIEEHEFHWSWQFRPHFLRLCRLRYKSISCARLLQQKKKESQFFSMGWWQLGFHHSGIRITLTKAHVNRRQSTRRFVLLLPAFPSSLSVDLHNTFTCPSFFHQWTKQRCELTSQKPLSPSLYSSIYSASRQSKRTKAGSNLCKPTSHTNQATKARLHQLQHPFQEYLRCCIYQLDLKNK